MTPSVAYKDFRRRVFASTSDFQDLKPKDALPLLVDFYREAKINVSSDSTLADMLIFEWQTFEWSDSEFDDDFLYIRFMRQFVVKGEKGNDEIWQLFLEFTYIPTEIIRTLAEGSNWCSSLEHLDDFEDFVCKSLAYEIVNNQFAENVSMKFLCDRTNARNRVLE